LESDTENNNLAEAFKEGTSKGNIDPTGSGKRQIQAKILNRMMSIDRQRALVAMKAWAAFAQEGSGRQQHKRFSSLDAYLPYRALDVGQM
jgi:ophiobolin F synthase